MNSSTDDHGIVASSRKSSGSGPDGLLSVPPSGNTGVQIPKGLPEGRNPPGVLGIGWAQGTTHSTSCADVRAWLAEVFGPAVQRRSGLRWYARAWSLGDAGVVVADGPHSGSSNAAEVYIVIPQGALDPLGWDGQLGALALLDSLGVRLSRVDVYYDDLARVSDPQDVLDAMKRGDALTHVTTWLPWGPGSDGGMTMYLGARSAECMVRVYRKWIESGNPADGVRWEMEAKGARAPIVADLVRLSATPAVVYFELLRAHCDFVDTSDGQRADRAPLLGWWSALVGSAGRATLAPKVKVESLARKWGWLMQYVSPTIALMFGARGSAAMNDLIDAGWSRARWDLIKGGSSG